MSPISRVRKEVVEVVRLFTQGSFQQRAVEEIVVPAVQVLQCFCRYCGQRVFFCDLVVTSVPPKFSSQCRNVHRDVEQFRADGGAERGRARSFECGRDV